MLPLIYEIVAVDVTHSNYVRAYRRQYINLIDKRTNTAHGDIACINALGDCGAMRKVKWE